eukprot:CAMPEP_0197185902 /NCGR_PEP_ID=MMETSP1423-20130617/12896_1 /TAXON_ID=476441 /ORGANISM="Pseudo-nitzschia heimii, Strain UNC1101" /LENGTH=140 /DNA_ID=CAMNT_0042637079 /DNA_START=20 /DNA_END=442 /DNA_ORIENTATION=+
MAWICVVVIQAFIHYFVLGARRDRIHEETEAAFLEDNLSYSSNDGSFGSDSDMMYTPHTPTGDPSPSSIAYLSPGRQDGNHSDSFGKIPFMSIKRVASVDPNETAKGRKRPSYLTQTGTEMLKSCSLKNMVEQQIRSVPQ